ncbi:MAG: ribosomal protein L7/L12 [Hyphomicrobiales bacterium]
MDTTYLIIGGAILCGVLIVIFINNYKSEPPRGTGFPAPRTQGATSPAALSARVQDIARDPARKIEAIKAYREETGLGLKEAKDAVEGFPASPGLRQGAASRTWPPRPGTASSPALSARVQEIARDRNRKIAAIKAYREETGLGLKEAKDAVEGWLASRG